MEKKYNFYDKNIIGHTEIRNLDCFYFTRYYPVNKYGYNENQEFIFDFKDGTCPEIYAQIFSRAILNLFNLKYKETGKSFLEEIIILPVPASTQEKHQKRYEDLFRLISEKTGVKNGYYYIKIKNNVEAKHLSNTRTSLDDYIEIDYSFLKEYNYIILIDDVITSGKTISELANKFKNLEILQKYTSPSDKLYFTVGMVLGKTFSHLDLLNDELENEKIVSDPNSTFKLNSFNNTLELDSLDVFKGIDKYRYSKVLYDSDYEFDENFGITNFKTKKYGIFISAIYHTKFLSLYKEGNKEKKYVKE